MGSLEGPVFASKGRNPWFQVAPRGLPLSPQSLVLPPVGSSTKSSQNSCSNNAATAGRDLVFQLCWWGFRKVEMWECEKPGFCRSTRCSSRIKKCYWLLLWLCVRLKCWKRTVTLPLRVWERPGIGFLNTSATWTKNLLWECRLTIELWKKTSIVSLLSVFRAVNMVLM